MKKAIVTFFVFTVMLFLTACSSGTASEKEIIKEIATYENFEEYDLSITSYSETKRKTDEKSNSDKVWVSIIAESDDVEYKASYVLEYTKYNNGWILDDISLEKSSLNARDLVGSEIIKNDLLKTYKELVDTYNLSNIVFEEPVVQNSELSDDMGVPYANYTVNVSAENNDTLFSASFQMSYELYKQSGWTLCYSCISDYSYSAKEEPKIENDIKEKFSDLIDTYQLTNIDIGDPFVTSDLSNTNIYGFPYASYIITATAENNDAYFEGHLSMLYILDMQKGWIVNDAKMTDYSYKAKKEPSETIITNKMPQVETLISKRKINDNTYEYSYSEIDNTSFDYLTVTWTDIFILEYAPDSGWCISDTDFEIDDIEMALVGNWQYKQGDEYFNLVVHNAKINEITYEFDLLFKETHIWHNEQTCELSTNGEIKTKQLTCSYAFGNRYSDIKFITPSIFSIAWNGGLAESDYYLEYRAYANEANGTSGFYVGSRLLTKVS